MSKQVHDKIARGEARVVAAPEAAPQAAPTGPRHQVEVDRNFELPTGLYVGTVAGYLGFLAVMLASFAAPALAIPMVIFALFIVAGFGIPAVWTRLKGNTSRPLAPGRFHDIGIMTNTGRCSARDASVQVLILPVLVVVWGLAIATIAAFIA
ncbi:MAG: hypothetical protein WBA51_03305 [Erythrobacter sp.]